MLNEHKPKQIDIYPRRSLPLLMPVDKKLKPIRLSTTLYKEFAEAMERGEKTEEYRQATPYWQKIFEPLAGTKRPIEIHFIVGPWWWDFEVLQIEFRKDLVFENEDTRKREHWGPYYILSIGKMLGKGDSRKDREKKRR